MIELSPLVLDQTPIKGHEQRLTCSQEMPDKDLSGDSSSSAVAEGGFKPTKISVSLKIKFENKDDLRALVNLSRGLTDDGSRKIYQILNQTAQAYNIRQVRFTERVRAAELNDEESWQVSFSLLEHNSVPERTEERQQAASTDTLAAQSTTSTTATTTEAEPTTKNYTGFEKTLKYLNDQLKPDEAD